MQEIRTAIETMAWRRPARPHDCVEKAFRRAGIPFQRSLETSWGLIDFLVASEVVVQIDLPSGNSGETFRRLGAILESSEFREGVLLSVRCREAFETEWHTRQAKSVPVRILPLRAAR